METTLDRQALRRLIDSVFAPQGEDRTLALLLDLPDAALADNADWVARREMVAAWHRRLNEAKDEQFERFDLVLYRNARRNNADLPDSMWLHGGSTLPDDAEALSPAEAIPTSRIFADYRILIAPTELSATAPLKVAAKRYGFRAATMPGFGAPMIPALRTDWDDVHRRCLALKALLDRADAARVQSRAGDATHELFLDLRHRQATASGGLVREPGTAGNLPSGETYIVPYEGERTGDPSATQGTLPIELDGELLVYRIEGNCIAEVLGDGPQAEAEREEVAREPAYRNVAELGLGVLGGYGVKPVGEMLLDEKLGLHIAFGRSDHFGGNVGPSDFSAPDKVVHIDRVYLPEVQPQVGILGVDLRLEGDWTPLMRDGDYVAAIFD